MNKKIIVKYVSVRSYILMAPFGGYSHGLLNPNPGGLVANMTSKTKKLL
jgi:hypothetical protein